MFQGYFLSDVAKHVKARAALVILIVFSVALCGAQDQQADLTQLSLEQLTKLEVTSVSKKKQKLEDVAAAVYVITQQDIESSGARNIPDLLRMVPGVDVAQNNAHTWAISIRGFGGLFTDKVLVLIDGRSVYTPTSSGVYWDQQNVPLEDIERIEVIRGPGGTIWGANAVNGVINIITKNARDTQRGLVTAATGMNNTADTLLQYGGKVGQAGAYRVFGSYSNLGNQSAADGMPAADGWHNFYGGFRSDWDLSKRDRLTVQGDLTRSIEGQTVSLILSNAAFQQATFNTKLAVSAGNLLERWDRTLSDHSDISLQAYFDRYNRGDDAVSPESRNTFDLDFHHHLAAGSRHDIVWGLGYRVTSDNLPPGFSDIYVPQQRTDNLFSAFLQDEIRITNSVRFTLGSKVEHNAYTGLEYEPGGQLLWTPTRKQAFWLSVARAIRQPARDDTDLQVDIGAFPLNNGGIGVLKLMGDDHDLRAEKLISYQAGYRRQIGKRFSLDAASFLNFYHSLQTAEPGAPFFASNPGPPHLVFPLSFESRAHAQTYGGEIFAGWSPTSRWRISPGYSFIHMVVNPDASSHDTTVAQTSKDTPRHKFSVRSQLALLHNVDWDVALYHVNSTGDGDVPAYNRVDTRVAWRVGEATEFSVVGQNLLSPQHAEFTDAEYLHHTQPKRNVFGKVTWHF